MQERGKVVEMNPKGVCMSTEEEQQSMPKKGK